MTYAEFIYDTITELHVKTDGGEGEPGEGTTACGSGWFPFNGFYPGGDAFPPQRTNPPANLLSYQGVQWNPVPVGQLRGDYLGSADNTYMFYVPGARATGVRISIVWEGAVGGGGGPLYVGLWIYPDRMPAPPYLDENDEPPDNPPPYNPDLSADANAGAGRLTWEGDPTKHITVVAGFVGFTRSTSSFSPGLAAAPREEPHYGWPGDPTADEYGGIWIEVEHDCP